MISYESRFKYDIFSNNDVAQKFVGKHNNRFKSTYNDDSPVVVCNWTELKDEYSSDIKEVLFEDFNLETVDRPISFKGFISSVDIPEDLRIRLHGCKKCGNINLSNALIKCDEFPRQEPYKSFCENCSNIEWIDDITVHVSNQHDLVFSGHYDFYVQSQRIVVSHPNSMKKVVVYIHSNKPLFTKKDVGKLYNFVGILVGNNENHYGCYNFKLSDILSKDKKKNKNMSYFMIAPHVEEVKQDISTDVVVDDTINVENNRDDVSPEWRKNVLTRDKCCVICGGEKHLEAHHIFGYKSYPELRDNVDNGITLCQFCHGNYHSQYGVKNPNPVTFVNFIKGFR